MPPLRDELIHANHPSGFALATMRHQMLSSCCVQVPLGDTVEDWSDDAFWDEVRRRLPDDVAADLLTGPSIEKTIGPPAQFRRRTDASRPSVPLR